MSDYDNGGALVPGVQFITSKGHREHVLAAGRFVEFLRAEMERQAKTDEGDA